MSMVVTGQLAPIAKLKRVEFGPSGNVYELEVEGAKPYVLDNLAYYALGSMSGYYEADGAIGRIRVRYGGATPGAAEVPKDVISLRTGEVTQGLYLNARYASLPPAVIKEIRQTVADGTDYSDATGRITAATIAHGGSQGLALELYDWIVGGTDSFVVCQRTIVRTRTVSTSFNRKIAQDDVQALFTPAQLATYLGSAIPFIVPALVLNADEISKGLVASWRKFQCDCDETAGGQAQLVEGWVLAKWSSEHYAVKA